MTHTTSSEEAIFRIAYAIPSPDVQRAYLDQVCANAKQIERLLELLKAGTTEDNLLDNAPWQAAQIITQASQTEAVGEVIGPYKLLQQIGEGGFGQVYLAEQSKPLRRKVALKVIKPGMDTNQVIARFEAERQALALMDHPNIARVLDGGKTEAGRPYFVMDLVKGVPITQFCRENHLTLPQRLQLFTQVCSGIQHAHQKGIIHRDIKPSNVLVTMNGDQPTPKVIDFGVSKAITQQLTEKTMFTAFGQIIGTPQYMSPEQAGLDSTDVDTRSDVYSLGILLYELLTGCTPINSQQLRESAYAEIQRIIREQEPTPPSRQLTSSHAGESNVAKEMQTNRQKLKQTLQGEIDWIVLKSLEKDRSRRYESPQAMADDVQRYLDDEVVTACPPSKTYRLRKFTQRHRTAVISGLLAVLALLSVTLYLINTNAELTKKQIKLRKNESELTKKNAELENKKVELNTLYIDSVLDRISFGGGFDLAEEQARKEFFPTSADDAAFWNGVVSTQVAWLTGQLSEDDAEFEQNIQSVSEEHSLLRTEFHKKDRELTPEQRRKFRITSALKSIIDTKRGETGNATGAIGYLLSLPIDLDAPPEQRVTLTELLLTAYAIRARDSIAAEKYINAFCRARDSYLGFAFRAEILAHRAIDTGDLEYLEKARSDVQIALSLLGNKNETVRAMVHEINLKVNVIAARLLRESGNEAKYQDALNAAEISLQTFAAMKEEQRTREAKFWLGWYYTEVGDKANAEEKFKRSSYAMIFQNAINTNTDAAYRSALKIVKDANFDGTIHDVMWLLYKASSDTSDDEHAADLLQSRPLAEISKKAGQVANHHPQLALLNGKAVACPYYKSIPERRIQAWHRWYEKLCAEGPKAMQEATDAYLNLRKDADLDALNKIDLESLDDADLESLYQFDLAERHYWVACAQFTRQDLTKSEIRAAAMDHFQKAAELGRWFEDEIIYSRSLLKKLQQDPEWPYWIPDSQ